jgi:hypothetical protein
MAARLSGSDLLTGSSLNGLMFWASLFAVPVCHCLRRIISKLSRLGNG